MHLRLYDSLLLSYTAVSVVSPEPIEVHAHGASAGVIRFNLSYHSDSSAKKRSILYIAASSMDSLAVSTTSTDKLTVQFALDAAPAPRLILLDARARSSNTHRRLPSSHTHTHTLGYLLMDTFLRDRKPREVAPFLRSLRQILSNENPAILRWTLDGKAFEIHDMVSMMQHVLPKYFKHSKYTSFQRQLNYFNFRKWTKSKAVVCTFSNPFFQRDQPILDWCITRKKPESPKRTCVSAKSVPKVKKRTCAKPVVIKLPFHDTTTSALSFPSPTDAHSIASELTRPSVVYGGTTTAHEPVKEQSLDWVDALYSSLEPPVSLDNVA
ncbi:hypothetical protein PsorP6_010329 [Peronosclerospora sorghi]|uniref:Uncharacterized protein n=1 Tax=Peronosclerospora sorghi TaxID=230839 RepID=A0ACC0VY12_9STRA|nr:hypothetical protein PsorP6_010329 [Peronosclerospora sorghi]